MIKTELLSTKILKRLLWTITPENRLYKAPSKKEVTVKVSNERNAVNRFMMEFAELERISNFDDTTKECIVVMKYDAKDETEILIRILSFGSVVEVIGPDEFRKQIAERVRKQGQLIFGTEHNI